MKLTKTEFTKEFNLCNSIPELELLIKQLDTHERYSDDETGQIQGMILLKIEQLK